MAKKKLKRWQAEIRNTQGGVDIVSLFGEEEEIDKLGQVISWSYPRYKYSKTYQGVLPLSPRAISNPRWQTDGLSGGLSNWTVALLRHHIKRLTVYNKFISRLDDESKDFAKITKEIQLMAPYTGWSYGLSSIAMYAYRRSEGLEAQRRWIRDYFYSERPNLSNLIYYAKGIQAEGSNDPRYISSFLEEVALSRLSNDDLKSYLGHILSLDGRSADAEKLKDVTWVNQPILDQYELMWSSLLTQSCAKANKSSSHEEFLKLAEESGDWRQPAYMRASHILRSDHAYLPAMADPEALGVRNFYPDKEVSEVDALRNSNVACADKFFYTPCTPLGVISKSIYVSRNSKDIEEILYWLRYREVALNAIQNGWAQDEHRREIEISYSSIKSYLEVLPRFDGEAFRLCMLCAIREGQTMAALLFLYNYSEVHKGCISYVPHDEILDAVSDSVIDECSE